MNVAEIVGQYLERFPEDGPLIGRLREQVAGDEKLQGKRNFNGHITAGAIVLSPDHSKVLMVHHNQIGRWLQPGGHWEDGEQDTLSAAQREAEEETNVVIAKYLPLDEEHSLVPIHIETHAIPARPHKDELEHFHHDFRYVFEAADETLDHQAEEVGAAAWFELDSIEADELRIVLNRVKNLMQA